MVDDVAVRACDAEYAAGRYRGEPPVRFVDDIVAAAKDAGVDRGLYRGCGNGRNYIPLTESGLDLRYLSGPKTGLTVHFWAARELDAAISAAGLIPVLALRPQATWRAVREQGLWVQWEGIYRRSS